MKTIELRRPIRTLPSTTDSPITFMPKPSSAIRQGRVALRGDTLKALRYQACMSQEEVAAECKRQQIQVSVATLKRAEAGQSVIFRTARELAKYYRVSVETLCV